MPAPARTTAVRPMPTPVVLAAHVGLHSIWAMPHHPVPTGHGCTDCVDDLRPIVEPLWAVIRSGQPMAGWLRAQQARLLHRSWSGRPTSPEDFDERLTCSECMDDLDVMIGAIERALAAHRAAKVPKSAKTPKGATSVQGSR